jgi:hypothetical protein
MLLSIQVLYSSLRFHEVKITIQVVATIGVKRGHTSHLKLIIVIGKFSQWKSKGPIVLLMKHISIKVWFQDRINSFHLVIGLRVKFSRQSQFHFKPSAVVLPEATWKLRSTVGDNGMRKLIKPPYLY